MTVSVIIQRSVKDESIGRELVPLITALRTKVLDQPGFLTAQTFSCLDCRGEYLVISTWHSLEDWYRWMNHPERQSIQDKVDKLLGEKTRYRYYEPVVGGIIPEFVK